MANLDPRHGQKSLVELDGGERFLPNSRPEADPLRADASRLFARPEYDAAKAPIARVGHRLGPSDVPPRAHLRVAAAG
jgi:hypothetical protein